MKSTIFLAGAIALSAGMATANVHPKSVYTELTLDSHESPLTDG